MTIIEGLEAAGVNVVKKVYVLSANEGNLEFDKLPKEQFPIILIVPPVLDDNQQTSGRWTTSTRLQGWVLDRDDQPTTDYDTTQVMKDIVEPCHQLGRQFFKKLNKQDIIDKQTAGVTRVVYTPVFGEFDGHLHGVAFDAPAVPFAITVTCVD